jgi:hypothetical protein
LGTGGSVGVRAEESRYPYRFLAVNRAALIAQNRQTNRKIPVGNRNGKQE